MSVEPALSATVSADETLSRFILSSRHFSTQPLRVKPEAFMPNREGEVSVFRVNGLDDAQIWSIGNEVANAVLRTLYGRADIQTEVVRRNQLEVEASEPPPRHANIIGWPENDKARQKMLALQLAAKATLLVKK